MGLLSACAGTQQLSGRQEASQYEQNAHRSYAAPGPRNDPWGPYIVEASGKYDIPERWIREVMRVESGGRTEMNGAPITSGAGAMGLMQVMPATYDELRGRYGLGADPYDPHNSILAGTAYIRELYDLYGSPGFLAAYNGGPGRLDDYLTRNRALPAETRRYVALIGPHITDSFPNRRSTAEMYAMNSLPTSIPAGPRYSEPTAVAAYVPPAAPAPASAPVEVAFAPPSDSDGAFDPPPGWKPKNMSRNEIAAYVPPPATPPAAIPAAPAPAPVAIAMAEPPVIPYDRMSAPAPALPARIYTPAPAPARQTVVASLPTPPEPVAPRSSQYAALQSALRLPEPPVPTVQTASAYGVSGSRHEGFRLVGPAYAAPAPVYHGEPGGWAIQVGAFGNEGLAHIAVGNAREQAGSVLSGAKPAVAGVREAHGTLYRARLMGLSRETATQACDRLKGRSTCVVLSPDAQS